MKDVAREDVEGVRRSLSKLGAIVAEVDRQLRYVWIDNPHPDFDSRTVQGKRDDELIPPDEAADIMAQKREAFQTGHPSSRILRFKRSDGWRAYSLLVYPIRGPQGLVEGLFTIGFDAR